MSKSKDVLAWSQNNMSEWINKSTILPVDY